MLLNIRGKALIKQDLNPPLYSSYHLSFTSSLPRSLLEELASLILANDPSGASGQLISSVHDQFLDFLVPSPNLFSLLPRRETQPDANGVHGKKGSKPKEKEVEGRASYVVLNDPKANELDIEEEIDRVARGLFSVIVTMGALQRSWPRSRLTRQASFPSSDAQGAMRRKWLRVASRPSSEITSLPLRHSAGQDETEGTAATV